MPSFHLSSRVRFLPPRPWLGGAVFVALGLLTAGIPVLRAAPLRIGYVDTLVLLKKMPQSIAARKTLEHEFGPQLARIHKEETRLEAAEKTYKAKSASLTLLAQTEERQKISSLVRRLRRHQRAYFEDLELARDQILANLQRLMVHAIHEYARLHHYDLVVGEGVFYAGSRVDITSKILAYLTSLARKPSG